MKYIILLFFLFSQYILFLKFRELIRQTVGGFKNNELQLMIKGEGISKYKPSISLQVLRLKISINQTTVIIIFRPTKSKKMLIQVYLK